MLHVGIRGVFISCLLAAALPSQERRPLTGRVVDASGRPLAGATVTLFRTPPCDATGAGTDRIDVQTDERGRFLAQLLPQAGYSAFATGPGADERMLSDVRDFVAAGADLELRLSIPARPRTLTLTGTEAWEAEGPLQLCALPVTANLLRVSIGLKDGKATIPPLPGRLSFAVLDRNGEVLWLQTERRDQPLEELRLPPPQSVRVLARDAAGKAVAGATIACKTGMIGQGGLGPLRPLRASAWRRVGVTAADGSAAVRFPAMPGSHVPNVEFCASAPGLAIARALWNDVRNGVMTFTLTPSVRIRLMAGGKPLAAHWTCTNSKDHISRAPTDADGWLDVRDGLGECTVVPDPVTLDGTSVTAIETLDLHGRETVVLDRLRRVRVQVLEPDRGPARGMPVSLLHHGGWIFRVDPVYTDAAGRVELRMGTGDWLLFVCDGNRAAWHSVMESEKGSECTLALEPLPRMRCRVVDKDGQPVRDAQVTNMGGTRAGNLHLEGEEEVLSALAQLMTYPLVSANRSDQAGLLELPFMPRPEDSWQVKIGACNLQSAPVPLRANNEVADVVVR